MGFLGFLDPSKPGPGVPKNAPPKPRHIIFLEVFKRKFWKLFRLNFLFMFFNIPAVLAALGVSYYLIQDELESSSSAEMLIRFFMMSIFLCVPVITVGPAQAGFTYILRNFSNEEHAWLWMDFKENARRNFKQSMIICICDLVAMVLFGMAMNVYLLLSKDYFIMTILAPLIVFAFVLFVIMHFYIYPMLVTFELTTMQIYKNALIFAIARLLPNIGILLLCCAIIMVSFMFNFIIGIILFPLLTVSLVGLIINFYVNPILKKYIVEQDEDEVEEAE